MKIYAVVFSNYDPTEVDSLWESEDDAQRRADELNSKTDWDPWEVTPMTVHPVSEKATTAT